MNRQQFLRLLAAGAALGASPLAAQRSAGSAGRKLGVWVGGKRTLDEWRTLFDRLRGAGVNMILPNARDVGLETLRVIAPAARDAGLEVHAWQMLMWSFEPLEEHPEWYAVNRKGESTATKPPYVDYYRFLCPTREEVQRWVVDVVREVAAVPGLTSVHLDYIRLPDVILPVALWPKYNLVQDRELPEFDYCYCDVCRAAFRAQAGLDPLSLEDPAAHAAWLQFRYDAITRIVAQCHDAVHAAGTQLTAAVFPTPRIARALVRQDWVQWRIDALMPMIYHGFYNEPVAWVGTATREGVQALAGTKPLHAGLYLPDLPPDDLVKAAALALRAGAAGLVLFDVGALQDAHWRVLPRLLDS